MILAGDIGGTKTNLAYFTLEANSLVPKIIKSYPSQQHRFLEEIVQQFVHEQPAEITHAAFGIAGPVVDGRSKLTNLGWEVDGSNLATLLHLNAVGLLNDLEATSYGTLRLDEKQKFVLNQRTPQKRGAIAVIAAGTGLGEGGLIWDGKRYRTLPSEGGHSDFAPRNEPEMDLLRFLLTKYDRVSYERVLSGPGIANLYEFFRSRATYPEPAWLQKQIASGDPSAAVSQAGVEEKDRVCVQTLELFVSLYGAEAGNLALKLLATGGVYVGGGIAPKILSKIQQGSFLDSFIRKGRYTDFLKKLPVNVILNDKTALLGAAHYALVMDE